MLASLLLAAGTATAQISELTWHYFGTGVAAWNTMANWTDGVTEPNTHLPDANTHVLFNMQPGVGITTYINFNSAIIGSPEGERNVGAISLLGTDMLGRSIRGNNSPATGTGSLIFHGIQVFMTEEVYPGIPADLDGQVVRLLIANQTTDQTLQFISGSSGGELAELTMVMQNSGIFYARDGTADRSIRITNRVTHGGEPVQIHFVGGGVLHWGTRSRYNDFGGGIILDGGIAEWTNSGARMENPWGGNDGEIIVRNNATLRSTSHTSGRTLIGQMVLQGDVSFGWDGGTHNANITLNSYGGDHSARIEADSTITVHNQTSWNQSIGGAGNLVKAGAGRFILTSLSENTFDGTLTHAEGILRVNGSLENAPATVLSGAILEGLEGQFLAGLTVEAGGILSPGIQRVPEVPADPGDLMADPPILPTDFVPEVPPTRSSLSASALDMAPGAILELGFDAADPENPDLVHQDRIIMTGPANLDGVVLDLEVTYNADPNEVFVLVDNQSGTPVSGVLHYNGQPLTEGTVFTIAFREFTHEAQITYNYNGGGYSHSIALLPPGGVVPDGYDAWREARYGDPNAPEGAPLAEDPELLLTNLEVYTLGLDLVDEIAEALPQPVSEEAVTFTRRADLEARLILEATDGHPSGNWDEIAVREIGGDWAGDATVTEEPEGADLIRVTVVDDSTTTTGVRLYRLRSELP